MSFRAHDKQNDKQQHAHSTSLTESEEILGLIDGGVEWGGGCRNRRTAAAGLGASGEHSRRLEGG